jgi:hypothetical protein
VDRAAYRAPEIASVEPEPVDPSRPVISQPMQPQLPAPLSQTAQTPVVVPDGVITRAPYQAYVQNPPAPPTPPAQPIHPETQYRPAWRDTAEADTFYRQQREAEYRRAWREATEPFPDEDATPRDSEYRRMPPARDDTLPFPAPRERIDRPN